MSDSGNAPNTNQVIVESQNIELSQEQIEQITQILLAEEERKKRHKNPEVFTEEENEWVRRFGRYYDFLEIQQKVFINFCLSEIHETTTHREWQTKSDKNIESFIEVLKILCPDSFDYEVKTLDDDPDIKTIIVNFKPVNIFHKFIRIFH